MKATLYAIGAVLLFSSAMLSLIGWAAKQPMTPLRGNRRERRAGSRGRRPSRGPARVSA